MSANTANLKKISLEDMEDMPVELSSAQAANDPDLLKEDVPPVEDKEDAKAPATKDADAEKATDKEAIGANDTAEEDADLEAQEADKADLDVSEAAQETSEESDQDDAQKDVASEKKERPKAKEDKGKTSDKEAKAKGNTAPPIPVVPISRMHSTMQAAREDANDDLANGVRSYQHDGTAKPQSANSDEKPSRKAKKKEKKNAIASPSTIKPSKGKGFGAKKTVSEMPEQEAEGDVTWNDVMPRLYGSQNNASFAARMLDKRPVRYGIIIGAVLLLHTITVAFMDVEWFGGDVAENVTMSTGTVHETSADEPIKTPLPPVLAKLNERTAPVERVAVAPAGNNQESQQLVVKTTEAEKTAPVSVAKPEAPVSLVKSGEAPADQPIVASPPAQENQALLRDISSPQPAPKAPIAVKPAANTQVDENLLYRFLTRH